MISLREVKGLRDVKSELFIHPWVKTSDLS